jgi:RNA 3'-terminal phosphate cyclase-like protein
MIDFFFFSFSIQLLRDMRDFFGVTYRIKPDEEAGGKTIVATVMGLGYQNVSRKVT